MGFLDLLILDNIIHVSFARVRSFKRKDKTRDVALDLETRMHSSRMRTGRSLTICWRLLPGGGCLLPGGLVPWGLSGPRGVWFWGASAPGGIPACTEADTVPTLWTESQTPVKTLPWPNFVAASNNFDKIFQLKVFTKRCIGYIVNKFKQVGVGVPK